MERCNFYNAAFWNKILITHDTVNIIAKLSHGAGRGVPHRGLGSNNWLPIQFLNCHGMIYVSERKLTIQFLAPLVLSGAPI